MRLRGATLFMPRRNFAVLDFRFIRLWIAMVSLLLISCNWTKAASSDASFVAGSQAYHAADYEKAALGFRQSATLRPASGTLQNLGLAEWQRSRVGPAIVAWEQALWLDSFNSAVHENLRFARKAAQIEAPELGWDEVVSTWLPVNWWAWIAGISLWTAVGMAIVPGVLRCRKAGWHQALAAFGAMLFLLSLPAHLGVNKRSHLAFVLQKETPLRLTPTAEAEAVGQLGAGEPVRLGRTRGNYVFVRTNRANGWIERAQLGLICPPSGRIE